MKTSLEVPAAMSAAFLRYFDAWKAFIESEYGEGATMQTLPLDHFKAMTVAQAEQITEEAMPVRSGGIRW